MKKFLTLVLALLFLFGAGALAVQADQNYKEKNSPQKGWEKHQKLKDVKGHWAEDAILMMNTKGFIKGYEDATFKPNKPVTQLEAIVMIVRAQGLEDEAQDQKLNDLLKKTAQIPAWAEGYMAVALKENILDEGEMLSFRPNQGAKRIQVALWITRALDLDDYLDSDDDLPYLDKKDIPEDLYNAVVLISESGIMKGNNKNYFLPNKAITRAEMAILLERINGAGTDANIYISEFSGIITDVDDDEITVKGWSVSKTFDFDDEVTVYLNGKKSDVDDLDVDDYVKLTLNKKGDVIAVKATSPDQDDINEDDEKEFEGKIVAINLIDDDEGFITIKSGNKNYRFQVDEDTDVEMDDDGETLELDELKLGWNVEIMAEGKMARSIIIESSDNDNDDDDEETEYEGIITKIDSKNKRIVIKDENGKTYTFFVDKKTEITIDEDDDKDDAELSDLRIGDEAEIGAKGNLALKIEVDRD
ncbi:S-layer homology domain-containing protein [Dehalobacterium formicoaceticum]|uniref:S-layer homology domain-containing protein n=1 Tax=Dehalobacterium formicoaceticum TaxID=51515 RepID=UPI000B7D421B|nr:S-layer homology domain-containing protein [Dehalobacterium formicoaceticum]